MTAYFVAVHGAQTGPFTIEEIRTQCSRGQIQKDTLMWREGLDDWQSAERVLQDTGVRFPDDAFSAPPSPPPFNVGATYKEYAAPSNAGLRFDVPAASLPAGQGVSWIGEGWNIFKAAPGMWIVALLIWLGIQIVLSLIPILGSLASLLLGPSFAVGLLAFAHGISVHEKADLGNLFAGFKDRLGALVILALLYFVLVLAVLIVGGVLAFLLLGGAALTSASENSEQLLATILSGGGLPFLLLMAVVFSLIVLVIMAYMYAPALVFFANQSAGDAMKQSFSACLRNWLPILVFGLLAIVMAIVGALPFGLGLLIVLPVLFAANYASFKGMFGR